MTAQTSNVTPIITVTTPTKAPGFLGIARKKGVVSEGTVLSIKRGDSTTVEALELWMEEGFNVRKLCQKHVDNFKVDIMKGRVPPAIEVKLVTVIDEDGNESIRLKVIDGHHRTTAYQQLIHEQKLQEDIRITVTEFRGDERDELVKMIVSSQGRSLSVSERINAYVRMRNTGMNTSEIAESVHAKQPIVSQYLQFESAPIELKEIMDSGKIGFSVVNNYRTSLDNFVQVLAAVKAHIEDKAERKQARKDAKENGGNSKIAGASKLKTIKMNKSERKTGESLISTLDKKLNELGVETGEDKEITLTLTPYEIELIMSQAQLIRDISKHNNAVKTELTMSEIENKDVVSHGNSQGEVTVTNASNTAELENSSSKVA